MMRKGIEILRKDLSQFEDHHAGHPELDAAGGDDAAEELAEEREMLREGLSSALCSLAELLMGNAAEAADEAEDEDGAAATLAASPALEECEKLLGEARELWPKSPEPLQVLCGLRKLVGKEEEALTLLKQSLELWYRPDMESDEEDEEEQVKEEGEGKQGEEEEPIKEETAAIAEVTKKSGAEAEDEDEGDEIEMDEDEDELDLPSYEFRYETAKLLLELDETMDVAADILEGLLAENDTVPDVWLLLAVAYRAGGELEAAAQAAKEGAETARKLGFASDNEVVAALGQLEQELGQLVLEGDAEEEEEQKEE